MSFLKVGTLQNSKNYNDLPSSGFQSSLFLQSHNVISSCFLIRHYLQTRSHVEVKCVLDCFNCSANLIPPAQSILFARTQPVWDVWSASILLTLLQPRYRDESRLDRPHPLHHVPRAPSSAFQPAAAGTPRSAAFRLLHYVLRQGSREHFPRLLVQTLSPF